MATTHQRHRSFSAKGRGNSQPVTFDIDGHEFTCRAQVPGLVLLSHLQRLMTRATAAEELIEVWSDVFDHTRQVDDDGAEVDGTSDYDRFLAYCHDPGHEVSVQVLGEVLTYVLGELTGRPTPPPSPSPRGRSTTSDTSTTAPAKPAQPVA